MTQNLNDERSNDLGSLFDDLESRYVFFLRKNSYLSTPYCCTLYLVPTRGTFSALLVLYRYIFSKSRQLGKELDS